MKNSSRTRAIIIGYITVAMQSISSILLTKIYLRYLGINIYGIYQMVFSIAQYILIFDFGIASTVMRFRTFYLEDVDKKGEENLLFHTAVILIVLSIIITIMASLIYINISFIYKSLNYQEVMLAKLMLMFMVLQILFTLGGHYFQGIAMSSEKYELIKSIALARVVIKFILVYLLLILGFNVIAIAIVDCLISLGIFIFILSYNIIYIKPKIKFHYYDSLLIRNIVFLMVALFLQSVATYVNNAADKTILGVFLDPTAVAVYSIAMTICSFFASIPNSMNSLYVPKATQMVVKNATGEELTDLVIQPGRVQFVFCGAVIAGFSLYGKYFIYLWIGQEAEMAWYIALILIIPLMFPLIQNVCLSILTAMNKRMFRSLVVVFTSVFNIIITIVLVKKIGMLGAPIGTAISIIIGNIIITNIYYIRIIHLNILRLYKEIIKGILICILVSAGLSSLTLLIPINGWFQLCINCFVFILIYIISLWLYGLNKYEKKYLYLLFNKIK